MGFVGGRFYGDLTKMQGSIHDAEMTIWLHFNFIKVECRIVLRGKVSTNFPTYSSLPVLRK